MKVVRIVNVPRTQVDMQIYIQSFCEAWIRNGGKYVAQSSLVQRAGMKNMLKMLALTGVHVSRDENAYLVCSRGGHLLKSSLPYCFRGEIIPMLWDCWPDSWSVLSRDLRLLGCKVCFMTSSVVAEHFGKTMPDIRFYHVAEAVDMNDYCPGKPLEERNIDIYEIGRKYETYHRRLVEAGLGQRYNFVYCSKVPKKGPNFAFDSWTDYCDGLQDSKITISFPASVTNPLIAGIETLTMRYWESMLSRCLIVGHAPKELIDILHYNPVIEADMDNPDKQLVHILANISAYQPLVDKNRQEALKYAPWDVRMKDIRKILSDAGYLL